MWIRIDRMRIRIHKVWSMRIRIRIQDNKSQNHLLKVKKKKIFSNLYLNLRDKLLILVSRTQLNADPTGSGSTSLDKTGKQERSPDLYIYSKLDNLPEMDVEYVSLVLPLRRELLPAVLARVDGQLLRRPIMIK